MRKSIVAYFSASGVTKKLATTLSEAANGDLFEIVPQTPYTKADLNWMDKKSRSSVEMKDGRSRPAIANKQINMADYDTIFIGFPIWWYIAPTIINTFLESYDFSGKTIVTFATSGGSGMGDTLSKLKPSCNASVKWVEGKVMSADTNKAELEDWIKSLGL